MTIIFSTEKTLALHFTINNILQKIVTNATTIEIQQKKTCHINVTRQLINSN